MIAGKAAGATIAPWCSPNPALRAETSSPFTVWTRHPRRRHPSFGQPGREGAHRFPGAEPHHQRPDHGRLVLDDRDPIRGVPERT
jgi:hypothetical protein